MDELRKELMDELLEAHKLAKASYPTARLAMLLAAWKSTVEKI